MIDSTLPVAPFYKGWDAYQRQLVKALTPLSPEQLGLGVAEHLRSIDLLARHIVGARARWFAYVFGEGGENLVSLATWDRSDQPVRSAAELVSGLETTWQVMEAALQRWTIAELEDTFPNTHPDPGEPEAFTRQWVIWHLIEHDLHHGGEISFALGMHGLAAIEL